MGLAFRVAWQYRYLRGDERTIFMRHEGLPCRRGRPTRCFAARFAGGGRRRTGWRRSCIPTLVITRTSRGHLEYWIAGEQNGTNQAYHAGLKHHTIRSLPHHGQLIIQPPVPTRMPAPLMLRPRSEKPRPQKGWLNALREKAIGTRELNTQVTTGLERAKF